MVKPENKQPWENQACPICRASKSAKPCSGHGGGSENSGGSTSYSSTPSGREKNIEASGNIFDKNPHFEIYPLTNKIDPPILALDNTFNVEMILNLLSEGKLVIDNDNEHNTLTIKLNYASDSLSPKQKFAVNTFLNSIVDELHAFAAENDISSQFKFETDKKGNILSFNIMMPTKEKHEAFMQQLLSQNLVFQNIPNFTNQGKMDSGDNKERKTPTPFSMKPGPRGSR